MYYINDRDLLLLLKELSDIRKEQLIKIRKWLEEDAGNKRVAIALKVVNVLLE